MLSLLSGQQLKFQKSEFSDTVRGVRLETDHRVYNVICATRKKITGIMVYIRETSIHNSSTRTQNLREPVQGASAALLKRCLATTDIQWLALASP